jgi:hypothetical protein
MKFAKRIGLVAGILGMALLVGKPAMAQSEVDPDHFDANPSYTAPVAAQVASDTGFADPGYAAPVQDAGMWQSIVEEASKAENMMASIVVLMSAMTLGAIGLSQRGKRNGREHRTRALQGAA